MAEINLEKPFNKKYFINIQEARQVYDELKRVRHYGVINTFDPDFVFNLTDMFLNEIDNLHNEPVASNNLGKLVRNKNSNRVGILLREFNNGSIQVLESIQPKVINTHDNWNTLELVDDINSTKESITDMSKEEMYKLALFAIIRNNGILDKGIKLNKTNEQINDMVLDTMDILLDNIDYKEVKKLYNDATSRC